MQTVRATGVVQPIRLVQVGTQVNGPVRKLYVDYNDRVKEGDLVAQIDPTVYEARLAQDEANLAQSLAVGGAGAGAAGPGRQGSGARAEAARSATCCRQAELDAAVANRDTLAAQLKVAQAAVEQARPPCACRRPTWTTPRSARPWTAS